MTTLSLIFHRGHPKIVWKEIHKNRDERTNRKKVVADKQRFWGYGSGCYGTEINLT